MRYIEFAKVLVEAKAPKVINTPEPLPVTKADVEKILRANGYEDFKINGNNLAVVTQIPDGAKKGDFRSSILQDVLSVLQNNLPDAGPEYSRSTRSNSSIGGIIFADGSPVEVIIKDSGKQAGKSAGVGNETEIASYLASMIEKFGMINVTFKDGRGKKLTIKNVDQVYPTGSDVAERKKADIVLASSKNRLPVSIKELSAETWESADSLFGAKAREIIDKLVKEKVVKLIPHEDGKSVSLSKEIVIEPTEEEAMNAIFGSDISPAGGIVIQDFEPKHYNQVENNISIECHAVITRKEDIPTSHMMVWLLRNNAGRMSKTLGIRGIRPMASVLNRAIGKKGTKDVILVDVNGNVVKNPNIK